MDFINLALIMEEKNCIVDGKPYTYYECIDWTIGFYYKFKNKEKAFYCLTGKLKGFELYPSDVKYKYCKVRTLLQLSENNNNTYDINKFSKDYQEYVGKYYTYIKNDNNFHTINDEKILSTIKKPSKITRFRLR